MSQKELLLENTLNLEQASIGKPLWSLPVFDQSLATRLRQKDIDPIPDFGSLLVNGELLGRRTASRSMESTIRSFVREQGWKVFEDKDQYWDKRGIDIIAYKNRTVLLIQCKLRRRGWYLTLPIVVKLLGSVAAFVNEHHARIQACETVVCGVLIGTTSLSREANKLACENKLAFFNLGFKK